MDLYIFILFILAVTLAAISMLLFSKHNIPGVKPFIVCLLLVSIWNVLDAVLVLLNNLEGKVIVFDIKMAFIVYIPALWLITILELTDRRCFKHPDNLALIIFPTITAFIILSLPFNNWYAHGFYTEAAGKYKIIWFSKGFWFWINACYNYLINAVSLILLMKTSLSKQYAAKKQAVIMIFSMLFPIMTDVMLVGNLSINKHLDITSASFFLSLLLAAYAIFRYGLMNIALIARERVFEDMNELMIVLDVNKKIVDMNRKALFVFKLNISSVIGKSIYKIIDGFDKYDFSSMNDSQVKIRFDYRYFDNETNYYGSVTEINGNKDKPIGYLILLYDTTELKQTQRKLELANKELIRLNKMLYEESIIDGLTKVYNKKHITMLLQQYFEAAIEKGNSLAIALVDIDYFKRFNDNYGHLVGDMVLEKVAEVIKGELTEELELGRFGGEEFLILMPGRNLDEAYSLCEKIRVRVENIENQYNYSKVTISGGIAQIRKQENMDSFIKRADDALYKAKENGRNRIEISK